jgi:hypothetical protein
MAQVASLRSDKLPSISHGIQHIQKVLALTNGIANSGDNIEVMGFPPGLKSRLHRVSVRQSATLGAGATLTAQVFDGTTHTAITGATTAAAASKVDSDSDIDIPMDLNGGERLELNVGGANITAGATVTVDIYVAPRA